MPWDNLNKSFFFFLTLCLLLASAASAGEHNGLQASTQLVVVTTPDWNSVTGTLQRFQRTHSRHKWLPVGGAIAVVVGKNGLGWGSGIASDALRLPGKADHTKGAADPIKKEGDGKAPAGIFRLSSIFGYAEQKPGGWKMPYLRLTETTECVDDPASKFYTRVLDRNQVIVDWKSSEHMQRPDELYRWGVVVDHNANPPHAGEGSCIFLHIWRGPGQGTVGCTAMPQEELETILGWLDPKQKPILVQLPTSEYLRLKGKWELP